MAVSFSPDAKTITSVSLFGIVMQGAISDGERKIRFNTGWACNAACFSPDGKFLALACDSSHEVRIWDNSPSPPKVMAKPRLVLKGHKKDVHCLAYSIDGNLLASGDADGTTKVWNSQTGKEVASSKTLNGAVFAIAFSPDGATVASAGEGPSIVLNQIQDNSSTTIVAHPKAAMISALAYSPDGTILASSASDFDFEKDEGCQVELWNTSTNKHRSVLAPKNPFTYVASLAFSPDSSCLAISGVIHTVTKPSPNTYIYRDLGNIQVWNVKTQTLASHLVKRHCDPFTSLIYAADGTTLAAGCGDCNIYMWSLNTKSAE